MDKRDIAQKRRRAINRKKKRLFKKILFFIFELIVIAFLIRYSSFFDIQEIDIDGLYELSEKEVIKNSKVAVGDNLFLQSKKKIRDSILENPMVKSVKIERKLFHALKISVEERIPQAEFIFNEKKFIADKDLNIISMKNVKKETIKIKGFISEEPKDMKIFSAEASKNPEALFIKQLINKYSSKEIRRVTLNNNAIIIKLERDATVFFGNGVDYEYKLELLEEMLRDIKDRNLQVEKIDMTKGKFPIVILKKGENI